MESVVEKLQRYAALDTQSDAESKSCPSTEGQWALARILKQEMENMGLVDVTLDENGYLFGTLPSTVAAEQEETIPVLGFLAHMDTAPDFRGGAKNTRIVKADGKPIPLGNGRTLTEEVCPLLPSLAGEELLVTDGSTLLGADDKAGIAEILCAMEELIAHPEIPHGKIRVGFTPDEEIGRGPHRFDVQAFGADVAYTMDGGVLGEFSAETFNAASAEIRIEGESIHPGSAKDIMINALLVAMEINAMLPAHMRPEHTSERDGFYMLEELNGNLAHAEMIYIIRDHDKTKFEEKRERLRKIVAYLNERYGERISLTIEDSYYNMHEVIAQYPQLVDIAIQAMEALKIPPKVEVTRGGTDGAQLSFMGLPTPNLFVGGMNFHGPYEFAVVGWMDKAVELIVEIARRFALSK